jgi:ribonuclease HI
MTTKPHSKVLIATDASCIKNDIKDGAGHTTCAFVVIIDDMVVKEKAEYLGMRTISEAEYYGIIKGIEYANKVKYKNVTIYSDSEFAVKQINGEYKVKAENIIPLHARVLEIIGDISVKYHKRDTVTGKLADFLAHNLCDKYKAAHDRNEYEVNVKPRIVF